MNIAYILGGAVAVTKAQSAIYRWWVIVGFAFVAVFVTGVRQRFLLGTERPQIRIMPYSYRDLEPRKPGVTMVKATRGGEIEERVEYVSLPGVSFRVVSAAVVNDPPGMRPEATARNASVLLEFYSLTGEPLLAGKRRMYARWTQPGEPTAHKDIWPSHHDDHWFSVAVRAERTGQAYVATPELNPWRPREEPDVFSKEFLLPSGDLKVVATVSATGLPKAVSSAFRLINNADEFRLTQWAD